MENLKKYTNNDVLCGRGKEINKHIGNDFFHDSIMDQIVSL